MLPVYTQWCAYLLPHTKSTLHLLLSNPYWHWTLATPLKPVVVLWQYLYSPHRCCVISAVGSSQKDSFFFYEDINTSKVSSTAVCITLYQHAWAGGGHDLPCFCLTQIAAWFGMGLLICLAILYGIILIIFCCRVTNVKRGDMYRELPESAAQ